MKQRIRKDLKELGIVNPIVNHRRNDTHSISYDVSVTVNGITESWDGHYFIGETGSKEWMEKDWGNSCKQYPYNTIGTFLRHVLSK